MGIEESLSLDFERSVEKLTDVVFSQLEPGRRDEDDGYLSFVPLFTMVHNLCARGGSNQLYGRLYEMIYTHTHAVAAVLRTEGDYFDEEEEGCGEEWRVLTEGWSRNWSTDGRRWSSSSSSSSTWNNLSESRRLRLMETLQKYEDASGGHGGRIRLYLLLWRAFRRGMEKISLLFGYLDRRRLVKHIAKRLDEHAEMLMDDDDSDEEEGNQHPPRMLTPKLGLVAWYQEVLGNALVGPALMRDVLSSVRRGRLYCTSRESPEGSGFALVNFAEIRDVLTSLVDVGTCRPADPLDVYRAVFETKYLEETEQFYREQGTLMLNEMTPVEFVRSVHDDIIVTELEFAEMYVHPSTLKVLRSVLSRALMKSHVSSLVAIAPDLIRRQCTDDLRRLHSLFSQMDDELKVVRDHLRDQVAAAGEQALEQFSVSTCDNSGAIHSTSTHFSDAENADRFVSAAWSVYSQFRALINDAFEDAKPFTLALDQGCSRFINRVPRAPVHLAVYSNLLLSSDGQSSSYLSEHLLEEELDRLTRLFRYIDGKDLFNKLFAASLAKRLITGTCVSKEAEQAMLMRIESTCGSESIVPLQKMFQDVELSVEQTDLFRQAVLRRIPDLRPIDFNVLVLTGRCWPLTSAITGELATEETVRSVETSKSFGSSAHVSIPRPLNQLMDAFAMHYTTRQSRRRLSWLHALSKVFLRANLNDQVFDLEVSVYQAAVLLRFNREDHLQADGMIAEDAKELVENGILLSTYLRPSGGALLRLNDSFSPRKRFLRFSQHCPWQNHTAREVDRATHTVGEDRSIEVQAVVVRIMKAAGHLPHNDLIQQTVQAIGTRFYPSIVDIKRQIDSLIDKDYLVRTGDANDEYAYVT